MSVISDLIEKVNDPDLRARLSEEVASNAISYIEIIWIFSVLITKDTIKR